MKRLEKICFDETDISKIVEKISDVQIQQYEIVDWITEQEKSSMVLGVRIAGILKTTEFTEAIKKVNSLLPNAKDIFEKPIKKDCFDCEHWDYDCLLLKEPKKDCLGNNYFYFKEAK